MYYRRERGFDISSVPLLAELVEKMYIIIWDENKLIFPLFLYPLYIDIQIITA